MNFQTEKKLTLSLTSYFLSTIALYTMKNEQGVIPCFF